MTFLESYKRFRESNTNNTKLEMKTTCPKLHSGYNGFIIKPVSNKDYFIELLANHLFDYSVHNRIGIKNRKFYDYDELFDSLKTKIQRKKPSTSDEWLNIINSFVPNGLRKFTSVKVKGNLNESTNSAEIANQAALYLINECYDYNANFVHVKDDKLIINIGINEKTGKMFGKIAALKSMAQTIEPDLDKFVEYYAQNYKQNIIYSWTVEVSKGAQTQYEQNEGRMIIVFQVGAKLR